MIGDQRSDRTGAYKAGNVAQTALAFKRKLPPAWSSVALAAVPMPASMFPAVTIGSAGARQLDTFLPWVAAR